jgi:hypothetical protein
LKTAAKACSTIVQLSIKNEKENETLRKNKNVSTTFKKKGK